MVDQHAHVMHDGADFCAVLPLAQLPPGAQREVECAGRTLLLAHTEHGVFAIQSTCSHAGRALLGGRLLGCVLFCPHHAAKFDVRTGQALALPAVKPLKVFPVRLVGGMIEVGPAR